MNRIGSTFARLAETQRRALMPYVTVGFPTVDATVPAVRAIVAAGADMVELGVPFSDPLADGPTIQASGQQALANGVTLRSCLETASTLRAASPETPFILMGYYNPIFQMGLEHFAAQAAEAGVDGVIVPDLPPEESDELRAVLEPHGINLIMFLTPTSDDERIALVAEKASGFVYVVSLTGVTGAREQVATDLSGLLTRLRGRVPLPLVVGFGISTPEQARQIGALADGVIVGSALIQRMGQGGDPVEAAATYVATLREGMDRER